MKNVIYDIGANNGNWTIQNLDKYPDCKFVLVEANPKLTEWLKTYFVNNDRVTILNACVSDADEKYIDFYIPKTAPYGLNPDTISTASLDWIAESRFAGNYDKPIKVISTTLDTLISTYGHPKYIKIDVEGYEHIVISGLTSKWDLLSFEWAEENKLEILQSIQHLNEIGYTNFSVTEGDSYTYIPTHFENIERTKKFIDTFLIPSRKAKWGMIFAK